jgi:NAD(P)-dependent dehydrogenase (short-subunit alcohol dehydrogenase family)
MTLDGKVAIVTGAAGGFGQVLVRALRAEGARVAALDVKAVRPAGGVLPQVADIADYEACERAVSEAIEKLGGLHILVNNGAVGMGVIRADHMTRLVGIEEITPAMWQRFMAVNLSGAWNMTRAAIGHLREQRWGRIINVTTSFFTMLRGGFHPYGVAKAGLEAMSAGHATEFRERGITVNVVIPGGPANTPMVPAESGMKRDELVQPEVMAPPIVWLCSEAAAHITGHRYVAAHWDAAKPPEEAERQCREPIGWPQLAGNPIWAGGKPAR